MILTRGNETKEIEKTIHIYLDPASTPAILQMVDFIRQPDTDCKIVKWDRYAQYMKNKERYKNVIFIDRYPKNPSPIFIYIDNMLEKFPNAKIILHFNLWHDEMYSAMLSIPHIKKRIKEVHVYEDSSSHIFRERRRDWIFKDNVKKYLHYWGDVKKLCSGRDALPACNGVKMMLKNSISVQVDFEKMASTLSDVEKRRIFDLAGYNYEKIKQLFKEQNVGVYVLGDDVFRPVWGKQFAALKNECEKTKNEQGKEKFQWLYKYHPSGKHRPTPSVFKTSMS